LYCQAPDTSIPVMLRRCQRGLHDPDGSKALVAYNDTRTTRTFQVRWGTQSFTYSLCWFAGATFTWSGTQNGGYTVDAKTQIQASSFNTVSGLQQRALPTRSAVMTSPLPMMAITLFTVTLILLPASLLLDVRVASGGSGGTLEFHLDGPAGQLIGSVTNTRHRWMAKVDHCIRSRFGCEWCSQLVRRFQREYRHWKRKLVSV